MTFLSVWLQKLSIAMSNEAAIAALRRTQLCTRQRVLGLGAGGVGAYVSWAEGRSAAGVER